MQKAVEAFVKKYQLSGGTSTRYIDLVSEIGELGKEILKESNYGKMDEAQSPEKAGKCKFSEDTVMEMGDCLFSLLALCCEMNIIDENYRESFGEV